MVFLWWNILLFLCFCNVTWGQRFRNKHVTQNIETTTYKYPTATWSAASAGEKKRKYEGDFPRLYLFKPSPFLKPPFTDGEVGASITGLGDDGLTVSGPRKGFIVTKAPKKVTPTRAVQVYDDILEVQEPKQDGYDNLLEQSLKNYLKSANLTDRFGTLSVEEFSNALKKIIQERKVEVFKDNEVAEQEYVSSTMPSAQFIKNPSRFRQEKFFNISKRPTTSEQEMILVPTSLPPSAVGSQEPIHYDDFAGLLTTEYPNEAEEERSSSTEEVVVLTSTTTIKPAIRKNSRKQRGKKKWRDTVKFEEENRGVEDGEVKLSVAESGYYGYRQDSDLSSYSGTGTESGYYGYRQDSDLSSYTDNSNMGAIPGEPNKDYPMLSAVPNNPRFKCPSVREDDGPKMVADRTTRCQVFYICAHDAPPSPVLCPNGTMFNENVLVCDWWYNVDCS